MNRAAAAFATVLLLTSCGSGGEGSSGGEGTATATAAATGTASPSSPGPPDECPERWEGTGAGPWVPAAPTTETPGRLVPDADPVEALVCRYDGEGALEGDVVLQDGLDRIRTDLLVPAHVEGGARSCIPREGGAAPHLLRLRYADGDLWLSAAQRPDACTTSGNGPFVSSAYLGDALQRSYRARSWVPPVLDPCALTGPGRAGQERGLLPPGWTSLVVCDDAGPREVAPDRAAQVGSLLAQLATQPALASCDGTPASRSRLGAVYAEGPPVGMWFTPGCEPSLVNGSLSARLTPAEAELLGVLLG